MPGFRSLLAKLILLIDRLTQSQAPKHPPAVQAELDRLTAGLALYEFRACPFCVRVRRVIRRLGLNIETRDARHDPRWRHELREQGGRYQVPCLRIEQEDGSVRWMYESKDIGRYLEERFEPLGVGAGMTVVR